MFALEGSQFNELTASAEEDSFSYVMIDAVGTWCSRWLEGRAMGGSGSWIQKQVAQETACRSDLRARSWEGG